MAVSWNPLESAPKDFPVMLDVGLPYAVVGAWNPVEGLWVYSDFQVGMVSGVWNDSYFENDYTLTIFGWLPLPDAKNHQGDEE